MEEDDGLRDLLAEREEREPERGTQRRRWITAGVPGISQIDFGHDCWLTPTAPVYLVLAAVEQWGERARAYAA